MVGREGGKAKPLKQPKKAEKVVTDEDVEFKKKMVCERYTSFLYMFVGRGKEESSSGRKSPHEKVIDPIVHLCDVQL